MAKIRLDKYLADMQIGTRSAVKEYIRKGRVRVNEAVVKSPEQKIDTETDTVLYDDKPVGYHTYEYFMLNKPQGVVSATQDTKEKTVTELITEKNRKDLFPVGRLDKDTEGLLLITNDGALSHELLSPKKHVDKTYFAEVMGKIGQAEVIKFKEGSSPTSARSWSASKANRPARNSMCRASFRSTTRSRNTLPNTAVTTPTSWPCWREDRHRDPYC